MRKILGCSLLLAVSSQDTWECRSKCGETTNGDRIVGGSDAARGAHPWQINLRACSSDVQCKPYCGGSLIDKNWILTAAHCATKEELRKILPADMNLPYVVLGGHELQDKGEQYILAEEIHIHPAYDPEAKLHDFALIKLSEEAICGPLVNTVCLQDKDGELPTTAWATGWGAIEHAGDQPPVLQEVELPLVSNEYCQERFEIRNKTINDHMICAHFPEGGKDTCGGDSGGPLSFPNADGVWTQVGVVSYGRRCATKEFPGVYARVSKYHDFIKARIGPEDNYETTRRRINSRLNRYTLTNIGIDFTRHRVSNDQVMDALENGNSDLIAKLSEIILNNGDNEGLVFETRPFDKNTIDDDFEFTLIDNSEFNGVKQDQSRFDKYISEDVTNYDGATELTKVFPSYTYSGAIFVAPKAKSGGKYYTHLKEFLKNADQDEIVSFWKTCATQIRDLLYSSNEPVFFSTIQKLPLRSGNWLTARIENEGRNYRNKFYARLF